MKSTILIISLLFPILCLCQTEGKSLVINKSLNAELSAGETHAYSVKSKGNQFLLIRVEQIGIDVNIIALSPSGKKLAQYDSPNGKNGPEFITLDLKEKGSYTFEVKPFLEETAAGKYTIELQKLEALGKTPEEKIDQIMTLYSSETPGASIAVLKDDKLVFSKSYGMANLEYAVPVDNSTKFHIASVSKQFTAFAILLLAEDGKIELDDDIRKYIPEVPDFGETITLRHLANHTSGLRDQWELLVMAGWRMDDVITTEQVLKLISRQEALNFKPGEEFIYCNTGFTLLAEVVERVSGMTFAEFTEKRIFSPLGMKNSLFYDDHEKLVQNNADSYYKVGNGYKKSGLNYAIPGATSLLTTAEDLTKWSANFEHAKIGNSETIRTFNTSGVLNNGDSIAYAFGQAIGSEEGLTKYFHGGVDAGFRSFLTRFPNEKLTVVVLGNEDSFFPGRITYQIVEMYVGELFEKEVVEEVKKESTARTSDFKVNKLLLEKYTGDYELQPGFTISILLEDSTLYGQATGQEKFQLIPEADTLFAIDEIEAKISFPESSGNPVSHFTLYQGGGVTKVERSASFDKTTVDLSNYTGFFYSNELATGYTVQLAAETLTVSHSKVPDFQITPTKKDTFTSTNWSFESIEYVRNESQEIIGFKVSNGRARNIYFEKR